MDMSQRDNVAGPGGEPSGEKVQELAGDLAYTKCTVSTNTSSQSPRGRQGHGSDFRSRQRLRAKEFDRVYQLQTFTAFLLIMAVVGAVELTFFILCLKVTTTSPVLVLASELPALLALKAETAALIATLNISSEIIASAVLREQVACQEFNAHSSKATADGRQIFYLQLAVSCITLAVLALLAAIAALFREHRVVKSRGKEYMLYTFLSSFVLIIALTLLTASFCLVFANIPDATQAGSAEELLLVRKRTLDYGYATIVVSLCAFCTFSSMYVQRMRVIYLIFRKTLSIKSVNFMAPYPITLFFLTPISLGSFTLWRFWKDYDIDWTTKGVCSFWFTTWAFTLWWGFYTLKTRDAHTTFSDYYYSVRVMLLLNAMANTIIIYINLHPTSLFALPLGWLIGGRSGVAIYCLDQFACQAVQLRHSASEKIPLTARSVSM